MEDFVGEMASLQAQIDQKNASLPGLITSEQQWRTQSQVACGFKLKGKQDACLADKQFKTGKANGVLAQITAAKTAITDLRGQLDALKAKQAASNTATVNLSTQGLSNEALQIAAQGSADAALAKAQTEAQATAAATLKEADTAASTSKTKNTAVIAIVVVVALVAIGLVVWKIKNSKKSKK